MFEDEFLYLTAKLYLKKYLIHSKTLYKKNYQLIKFEFVHYLFHLTNDDSLLKHLVQLTKTISSTN